MSEVLTLLPLGSAAREQAKTFNKILPYMYQFQEARESVVKRCLLAGQLYLSPGRNPFPITHLRQGWAADHPPASNHLGTSLHSSHLKHQMQPSSTLDPFNLKGRGQTSSSVRIHAPVCLSAIVRSQSNPRPAPARSQTVKRINADIEASLPSATWILLNQYHEQDLASTSPILCTEAHSRGDSTADFSRIKCSKRLKFKKELIGLQSLSQSTLEPIFFLTFCGLSYLNPETLQTAPNSSS